MVPSLCPKSLSHFYKHMELSIAGRHHCGLKQMARLNARTVHCSCIFRLLIANEPAERRRLAAEAAKNSAARRMAYAKKNLERH